MGTRWYSKKVFKLTKSFDLRMLYMRFTVDCKKVFKLTKSYDCQVEKVVERVK